MDKLQISGVCRCCLSQPMNLNDLFQSNDDINIAEIMQDICGIDIHKYDNCLPDKICDDCLESLKVSYNFRMTTRQSDKTLRSILEGTIILKEYNVENDQTIVSNQTESITTDLDIDFQCDEKTTEDKDDQELATTFDENPEIGLQCPYCQKDFVHLKNLRTHVRRHFIDGKYLCSHCPNRYHTKFDLQRHLTKTHSDGNVFKCDLCNKDFPNKPELNRHIRSHNEEKSFLCNVCGMGFKTKHSAQEHINLHDKKKRFFCEICTKSFAFACKLKYHQKSKCKQPKFS